MKTHFKSILKVVLTIAVCVGLVFLTAESGDAKSQIIWSISWMAEVAISGWALVKLFPEDFKSEKA